MKRSLMRLAGRVVATVTVLGMVAAVPAVASAVSPSAAPNPADFGGPIDNPWFPLTPGTTLVYKGVKDGKRASDVFHVTGRTKTIQGVKCVAVEDTLVFSSGWVGEKTTDWYAQDLQGAVWYFGERTTEYDQQGNVVSTEGTWQAGVDGAQAGTFMPADPHVGDTGVQEYYPGHAEDHFRVMSVDASVTVAYGSFDHSLRTREWTPLEPGVRDSKYFAKGIGNVLEQSVRGPLEKFELVQVITQ
jgi:hypothetical protein